MRMQTIAAVTSMVLMLGSGSAMAWDLHDTLAPGPTPLTAEDAPPPTEDPGDGADLQIPGADLMFPGMGAYGSTSVGPAFESQCLDARARHGENSAEARTFC